jgi:hypothetical protein
MPVPGISTDLEGKIRDAVMPDTGCFENEFYGGMMGYWVGVLGMGYGVAS